MATRLGWTRQELLVAFSLYCRQSEAGFGRSKNTKQESRNHQILGTVCIGADLPGTRWTIKLTNIASLDDNFPLLAAGTATTAILLNGHRTLMWAAKIEGNRPLSRAYAGNCGGEFAQFGNVRTMTVFGVNRMILQTKW